MNPSNPATPSGDRLPALSKRQFLTGAVAGACLLQTSRWVTGAVRPAEEDDKVFSYAQAGEDLVVAAMFDYLGLGIPSYLDIGAYDPVKINNTYLFYSRGSRGVLVEPNPDMTARLRSRAPRDTVLPVGIGVTDQTEADYYRVTEPSWNTFDKDTADHYVKETKGRVAIKEVIKVPLVNINKVFAENFDGKAPDYISLDVEGFEVPILRSVDYATRRPKVICVETLVAGTNGQKLEAVEFLESKGYAVRGASFANTILVDKSIL